MLFSSGLVCVWKDLPTPRVLPGLPPKVTAQNPGQQQPLMDAAHRISECSRCTEYTTLLGCTCRWLHRFKRQFLWGEGRFTAFPALSALAPWPPPWPLCGGRNSPPQSPRKPLNPACGALDEGRPFNGLGHSSPSVRPQIPPSQETMSPLPQEPAAMHTAQLPPPNGHPSASPPLLLHKLSSSASPSAPHLPHTCPAQRPPGRASLRRRLSPSASKQTLTLKNSEPITNSKNNNNLPLHL